MKIEHFALNVKDPVAMAKWYSEHLGMRVVRAGAAPVYTTFLADETGQVMVEIYHNDSAPVPDYAEMDPLVVHMAFVAADDIRLTVDKLLDAGATLYSDIALTAAGDQLVMLRDPWGFCIQFAKRQKPMI
ncbi:MAG TPA: VOC family protein [Anaerolineae bacterium]|jgi:catechol 2,3-dioxygenase-like lactoylglutathione lyase family enzyme